MSDCHARGTFNPEIKVGRTRPGQNDINRADLTAFLHDGFDHASGLFFRSLFGFTGPAGAREVAFEHRDTIIERGLPVRLGPDFRCQ